MGGDGGVIASNRKFMRGAGTADHTGDSKRNEANSKEHNALEAMTTCTLTKAPLFPNNKSSGPIVACSFGRLYQKEAAVQALLRKRRAVIMETNKNTSSSSSVLGDHVRKLSDLYDVRFHQDESSSNKRGTVTITCPITGKTLQGIIPAILLVPGKPDTPNVLSASALQQLGKQELELEYGPIQKEVRLAPPRELLKKIKEEELEKRLQTKQKNNKKKKKRKHEGIEEEKKTRPKATNAPRSKIEAAAKCRVETTIQSSRVLSSLFTTSDQTKSDKDRKDSLFAR
jgi:hypothetical protein